MYCPPSLRAQLLRGVVAIAAIVGGVLLTPLFWPAAGLFAVALYSMRGCPMCWLSDLFAAIRARSQRPSQP